MPISIIITKKKFTTQLWRTWSHETKMCWICKQYLVNLMFWHKMIKTLSPHIVKRFWLGKMKITRQSHYKHCLWASESGDEQIKMLPISIFIVATKKRLPSFKDTNSAFILFKIKNVQGRQAIATQKIKFLFHLIYFFRMYENQNSICLPLDLQMIEE